MNTKTNKVRKLLSLMLALTMIVTVVMPTSVFAVDSVTITTTLGDSSIIVDTETEFTVTINPGSVSATVMGNLEIMAGQDDISSLEYFDSNLNAWETLPMTVEGGNIVGTFGVTTTGGTTTGGTTTGGTTTGGTTTGGTTTGGTTTGGTTTGDAETTGTTTEDTETSGIATFSIAGRTTSNATETPMVDETSKFKIKFANAGDYSAKIYAYNAENNETLGEKEISISVIGYADYTSLDSAIDLAETYNSDEYTAYTFSALEAAVDNAKAVDRNLLETEQSIIDALEDAVIDAIDALVKIKTVTFTAAAVADDASVDYAKANKIVLVFAEPIADSANEMVSKLNIKDKVSDAAWTTKTVYTLTLKENHGLTNNAEVTFDGDETIFTVSGDAMADATASVVGNLEEAYEEVTATSMTATIVKASDKPGVIAGDKIVLVFNAPVYENPDSITVNGMTADVVAGTYNTVYEINLEGDESITDSTKLSYGSIVDVTLNGTFGAAVAPKALAATAVDNDGTAKTANDQIVIVFDRPTNGAKDITSLAQVGTDAKAEWSENNTKLTITIGTNATIENGDTLDISSIGIKDKDEIVDAINTSIEIGGSFGTVTAPVINSAHAVDVDKEATVAGDQIIITFDRPTNSAAIDLTRAGIIVNQASTFGTSSTFEWLNNGTKLVITLGANANIQNGVEIDLSNQGIMDADSIIDADIEPIVVEGSFGSSLEPKITRAIAFTQNNKHIIRTFFNTEVEAKSGATLDVYIVGYDMTSTSGKWTHNGISYYDIVLSDGHDELQAGSVVKFEGTLVDSKTKNMELVDATSTISGGFEQDIDMEIISLTAYSNDGSGVAKAGDRIVLVLNSEATSVDCDLGEFETDDNITWVYTLKSDNEVEIAKKVTFTSIKSKTNGKTYTNMSASIAGSFGYVVEPKLLSATAYSKDGSGVAKAGDEIIVVFDSPVTGVTSSLGTVSTDDNIVWKITLSNDDSVTIGTTLNFTVKSTATGKQYSNLSADLAGSFGKVVEPEILSATAYSNDGSGIAKEGDKIVVVFNAPVLYVSSALGKVATDDNTVWTITLGANPTIAVGAELSFDVTSVATNKDYKGLKVRLAGSFGKVVEPEILSATAVSNDGSGIPKVGDKIIVIFNTLVEIGGQETYVYTYELKANDTLADFEVGKDYSISVKNVSTGKSHNLVKEIEGSYGLETEPTVKSVVLSEANGAETITVVFDRATNKASIDTSILYENNNHLGQGVAAAWSDEYVLKISLAATATTTDADKLNLSGLGIKAADTGADVSAIDELAITGTLVPVVKDVSASGKNIVITFSTRTNGVANISNLTTLLGTGATASWSDNNKVLTITLGENYTITNNGYIVLNGMGIYDAFSGTYHVVGQYKVLGSIDTDKLAVSKIVAQSRDKSKTTAQKDDTIVIKFNSATNRKGTLDSAQVDEIITIAGGNEAALGTGYTGKWTASDTLEITLGGATTVTEGEGESATTTTTGNDPAIVIGTEITVSGVAFANGEGEMDSAAIVLTGSFNGREFILTDGAITRTGANNSGDYRVAVKVEDTLLAPSVVPTIVCVAYNGASPVSVMRINVDIENTIQPVFEFAESLKITSVKIYVFNEVFGDVNSSPNVLAETLEIK